MSGQEPHPLLWPLGVIAMMVTAIFILLAAVGGTGIGLVSPEYERQSIGGVDCVVAVNAPAVSCDWPDK